MSEDHDAGTRSFRSGDWFGIFGDRATVLLPPTEKARVAALWELVDDRAGFDEVLDALIADGLRQLPGFVLISERDGETKVVLRGPARATFVADGESVELEGSSATTWVERSLHGVTRTLVQLGDETDGPDLTIGGGLVRLSRLDEPRWSPEKPGLVDGEAAPVGDNASDEADVEPADDGAGAADAPDDDVSSMVESTWLEEPAGEPEPADDDEPGHDEPDDELDEDEPEDAWPFSDTGPHEQPVDLPTEAIDLAAIWASPTPVPTANEAGAPEVPGASGVSRAASGATATLRFSSGETVEVDRTILVGRAPEARRHSAADEPRLVTVPSPHQEISSTHLEVRPGAQGGSAIVTDLGSTNGTVVVQPGQPPEDLEAGTAVPLGPGAVIDLGDGVTIQVSNP